MNRSSGVQDREAGLRTRLIFWLMKRRLGRVPPSARIQARDPRLLELSARMTAHLAQPGVVPRRRFLRGPILGFVRVVNASH